MRCSRKKCGGEMIFRGQHYIEGRRGLYVVTTYECTRCGAVVEGKSLTIVQTSLTEEERER